MPLAEPAPESRISRRQLLSRAAALALAGGPAAGLLAACAGSGGGGAALTGTKSAANPLGVAADAPLEVVIFNGGFGEEYAKYDEGLYTKAFPAAKITHTATQKISDLLQPRFAGGTPPDVVDDSGDGQISVGTLVNNNALADLAPLFDAPSLDDPAVKVRDTLLPGALDVGTYNDKVYVLNYGYTVYGLWYNAKLFRERGWRPPRTWTEFTTLAPVIKAAGIAPLVHAGKYPFYMGVPITDWVAKVGGQQLTVAIDNLEPNAWRNDAVRTAVNAALELVRSGWVLPGAEGMSHTESQQAFLDGKAAFIPVGSWLENEMRKTIPPGTELTLIPMPSLTDHDAMPYGAVRAEASEPFIVPAKAHNVNGGLEFLRLMLGRDASRKFSELTSSLCVVKGAADGVTASTALASANRIATSAGDNIIHFRSFIDWYKPFRSEWEAATGELMAGRFTVEEWIDKVQAGADAIAADSTVQKYHRTK